MGLLFLYLNFTLDQTYSNQGLRYTFTEGNKIITIAFYFIGLVRDFTISQITITHYYVWNVKPSRSRSTFVYNNYVVYFSPSGITNII